MPIILEREDERSTIRLEGEVGIASAAELKELLVQALGSGQRVRVSLCSVTDLDVTTVELLWAARREAKASGSAFVLEGPIPPMVLSGLLQAGLDEFAADLDAAEGGRENP